MTQLFQQHSLLTRNVWHKKMAIRSIVAVCCVCAGLIANPTFAQELNCDVSVAPSVVLKSVKKHAITQRKIRSSTGVKSKLSTRTVVAKASLYPATVLKLQGQVFLLERQGAVLVQPQPLTVGSTLELGDVLETSEQSFISLELGDGVISVLPSNSRIALSQSDKVARFILIHGRVESYVPKHQKALKNTFEIQVPNAIVGVRGTHFLVSHSIESHQTKASVEEGTLWVRSRQLCRAPVVLEAGQGLNVERLDSGHGATSLLPAPAFFNLDQAQHGEGVVFNLSRVNQAALYHVQIAKDADFIDIKQEASNTEPTVTMPDKNLANGFYYARSSAIDSTGIEGQTDIRFFLKVHNNQINSNRFEP